MPALLFGKAVFEGGHRLSALGDLVEDFAVCDTAHALRVGETGGGGIVRGSIRTITLSRLAVAVGAFVEVNRLRRSESGWRGWDGIFAELGCFGDFPFLALIYGDGDGKTDQGEESDEKKFT